MHRNSVSVVIPCYNCEATIERAITSVVFQTFPVSEIIVVNDGSTDRSLQILNQLSKRHKVIKVFTQENHGLSSARNLGMSKSSGEFIAYLDGDDYWLENKIQNQLEFFAQHPNNIGVASNYYLERDGKRIPGNSPPNGMPLTPFFLAIQYTFLPGSASSILIRNRNTDNLRFETFLAYAEDLDYWIRLASVGSISVLQNRDVVITQSPNGIQGKRLSNPLPYLNSMRHISTNQNLRFSRFSKIMIFDLSYFQVFREKFTHRIYGGRNGNFSNFNLVRENQKNSRLYYFQFFRLLLSVPVYYFLRVVLISWFNIRTNYLSRLKLK